MDADLKEKWVKALRSGEYEQNIGSLGTGKKLCCLGVLSVVATGSIRGLCWGEYVGEDRVATLIDMNDGVYFDEEKDEWPGDKSFAQIADYIEANIPGE